jgi:hypothetical protein
MGIAKVCSPATETKGGDRKSEVNAGGGSVRSPGAAAVQALRGGGAPRAALRGRRRRSRLGRTREALPPPFMGHAEHPCRGRGGAAQSWPATASDRWASADDQVGRSGSGLRARPVPVG